MTRIWTDRDGTSWEVEVYDGKSVDERRVEERWIEFQPTEGEPAIVAPYVLEKPEQELSSTDLQGLLSGAKRGAGIER